MVWQVTRRVMSRISPKLGDLSLLYFHVVSVRFTLTGNDRKLLPLDRVTYELKTFTTSDHLLLSLKIFTVRRHKGLLLLLFM